MKRVWSFIFCLVITCGGAAVIQAGTLTVTKTADTNGVCNSGVDCSLREAIAAAAANDTIVFASPLFDTPQTITLSDTAGFQTLVIGKDLTIEGRGANQLTIQRLSTAANRFRIFEITGGTVNLSGMTITGGSTMRNVSFFFGGGIKNSGNLTLNACNVTGNADDGSNGGGGIYDVPGSMANLTLINSSVSGNTATNTGGTAGISHSGNLLSISNSTISGNICTGSPLCSTGAISMKAGSGTITNSTITNNSSIFQVGGISNNNNYPLIVSNSIIAGNRNSNNASDLNGQFTSSGYNIIGSGDNTNFVNGNNGDQVGTGAALLDPGLNPLGNYGGPTPTHSLMSNSPAIDKGNSFGTLTDQRGLMRPVDLLNYTNAIGGDGADVGAFETQFAPTAARSSISGRVISNGRGLANARVQLTDTGGTTKTVLTNGFGYFSINDVESGATYVVSVSAKRYTFAPQVVSVTDNISGLTFTAQQILIQPKIKESL